MKWNKYTIATTTEAEDVLSAMLCGLGIEGVEIENNVPLTDEELRGMFVDFPPELSEDHGESKVSFYLDAEADNTRILQQVRDLLEQERGLIPLGPGEITCTQTKDADWENNWKRYFTSFTIGNILIKPTWEELKKEEEGKICIEIDPGISFGTGKHETTQLCIRQLAKYMQGSPSVLDVGCGSGILSIVACKLGASEVVGIDVDENCILSTRENMETNHLAGGIGTFYVGDLTTDAKLRQKLGQERFEVVVANILADVIIPMAPYLFPILKAGGVFITSGIIDFKEMQVRTALEQAGFEILETNVQGEWVNLTAKKKER